MDKRLRSSGGKFKGWASTSILCRREDEEVRNGRDDLLLVLVVASGTVEWREEDEEEDFLDGRGCGFVGDEGSERFCWGAWRSSTKWLDFFVGDCFLLPLPKNFIGAGHLHHCKL